MQVEAQVVNDSCTNDVVQKTAFVRPTSCLTHRPVAQRGTGRQENRQPDRQTEVEGMSDQYKETFKAFVLKYGKEKA